MNEHFPASPTCQCYRKISVLCVGPDPKNSYVYGIKRMSNIPTEPQLEFPNFLIQSQPRHPIKL